MKAARITKPNESSHIQQLETPKPKGSQVLVKVNSSGVCHSDIHLWQGGYEGPGGQFLKTTDRGVKYPLTPGHEIAATVESIGEKMGADAIIDFVNASKTVETDMQLLRRRGKLVLVGLFGGEVKLNLVSMPTRAYKIIGSYTGSISEMVEFVSLAKRGVIKPVVSERFKLEQATEALRMLKDGKIIGRGVINP